MEAPFLSPPVKSPRNTSNEADRRRGNHHHHHAIKREGIRPLEPGQVLFRLLCHVGTVGGVIGTSGAIIKNLEAVTGVKIRVEDTILNCHERVINVIGFGNVERRIRLEAGGGYVEEYLVSQAQEGLLRVFERVLEIERAGGGVIGCRLLAEASQIGPLMGKGGSIVSMIRKRSGAKIKVLPQDQLPECVSPADELIQIMGDILAVKKGLLDVSRCLQGSTMERPSAGIYTVRAFADPHAGFSSRSSLPLPSLSGNYAEFGGIGLQLSADVDRILALDEGCTQCKVAFRLLCSANVAGGMIGQGATIVKALEKETGASIKIAAPIHGSKERIATVSALERRNVLYSPSQIALVRIFARSMEVGVEQGLASSLSEDKLSARLLVASNQVNCLIDERGMVASDISTINGVEIQILGGNLVPDCFTESEKVVQVIGGFENVKSALFKVAGRLRDYLFSSISLDVPGTRHDLNSSIHDMSCSGQRETPEINQSSGLSQFDHGMTQGTDQLRLPSNLNDPPSPRFTPSAIMDRANKSANKSFFSENGKNSKTSGGMPEQESIISTTVTNRTVEVVLSKLVFGCIYGEDGNNLALVKQISGAKVEVQNPLPGEGEGKVIISGMPHQTLAAQSLLQAFISTKK